MRITNSIMFQMLQTHMQRFHQDLYKYTEQVSSGRRINRPSDDAPGTSQLLALREEMSRVSTYTVNIETGEQRLQAADDRLNDYSLALTRAVQLAEQGSSGTVTGSGRRGIAEEVESIKQQLLSVASSTVAGRYIFAGTLTTQASLGTTPPGQVYSCSTTLAVSGAGATGGTVVDTTAYTEHLYQIRFTDDAGSYEVIDLDRSVTVATGTATVGAPDSITVDGMQIDYTLASAPAQGTEWSVLPQYVYNGNDDQIELQVDENTRVVENVPGSAAFGGSPGVPGSTVFDELVAFRYSLLTDDSQAASLDLETITARLEDLNSERAKVGGRISNLRSYRERSAQRVVDLMGEAANLENVDLPEAISKLVQSEGGQQATLQVGARIGQLSLFDYLR